jgi:hypothetical protein
MNKSHFNKLISQISPRLIMLEELGKAITPSFIDEVVNETVNVFKGVPGFSFTHDDIRHLKFKLESMFNIKISEDAIKLSNPDLPLWFHSKKSQIEWPHWEAYREMLLSQARSIEVINENEKVIDSILDYSGDPTTPGSWSRKGLVMGNVQSGKTQNFLGLINKAIDCGYKTIIVLGGHLNDLRKQTQERIDEGVLGRESKHLIKSDTSPIGVGVFYTNKIHTGTSTMKDFNKASAESFGIKLSGTDPVIFTIKKHTGVLEGLYSYIKEEHMLSPDNGKKLDGPLLLIDDEADYASINTKHHKEEVTKTNDCIRRLLSLFNRNTYVGYTATPFANIFIDPDENSYDDKDDLFPKDFMIKIPVPDNYMGQDFFFGNGTAYEVREGLIESPSIIINDHLPIFELKKDHSIHELPESLREAVRSFILVVAIRILRGERTSHNTMLVNISHLKDHQNQLEYLIEEYRKDIYHAIASYSKQGVLVCRGNAKLNELENTFNKVFNITEEYEDVFEYLNEAIGKINTWAINQSNKKNDNRDLDYSKHKENGLSAIVIGGHKLSRGLTLEGLSISYFARNSKAYDTLMQMCRWFGYRPSYKDLCRVYLPQESEDWYSFIASSIKELYQELDLMARRGDRPSEFGLKVREHPGAMIITAKNKIGSGVSEVIKQDLWGQMQRRFKFRESKEVNAKNLMINKKFIEKLISSNKRDYEYPSGKQDPMIFSEVSYDDVIEFIENINLPEDDIGNRAVISHLKSMKEKGLKLPKVCVFNQKSSRNPTWIDGLEIEEKKFLDTKYDFCGEEITIPKRGMNYKDGNYYIPSVQLGNPDDEKVFLKNPDVVINSLKKKPVSFDYLCADERDFPGLIIYFFGVAHIKPFPFKKSNTSTTSNLVHGLNPTLGFTMSFPRIDKLKGLSKRELLELNKSTKHEYKINKIKQELEVIATYEDIEYE